MMVVPLVLVALVVLAVVSGSPRAPQRAGVSHAQQILDHRLAAGEIGSDEHARRSATLTQTQDQPQPQARIGTRRPTAVLLVTLVAGLALLGAALAWGGSGWDWSGHDRWMAGHMGWSTIAGSADPPVAGATTVEVVATDLRFTPTTITVTVGVATNLALVNDGRAFHDLTIPALGFRLDADPGQEASGSLTADEPGTYDFECSVPGHAEAGMRGTLIVEGAPS